VYNNFSLGQDQGLLLFADDDNETAPLYVSALQLRNYTANNNEIKQLGPAQAKGIPINNTGIYFVKCSGETDRGSIVNWGKQSIVLYLKKNTDLTKVTLDFKLPFGATPSVQPGSIINLNKIKEIVVTAQDGVTRKVWRLLSTIK